MTALFEFASPRRGRERKVLQIVVTSAELGTGVASRAHDPKTKSQLGQYFTPATIARYMAALFVQTGRDDCRLLDAGAGAGAITAAFVQRCESDSLAFQQVEIDAFEIDESLQPFLCETIERCGRRFPTTTNVRNTDFVLAASQSLSGNLFAEHLPKYTHAILNPPYKKIRSNSEHRTALRRAGIETVNLYSAFVGLALALLEDHGQLVAIVPRSFCNGPYYRPFRAYLLQHAAIQHMHLFASRSSAFKKDGVLQENIIIRLQRGAMQKAVTVSTSTDDSFDDLVTNDYAFERIVEPDDSELFIHVPLTIEQTDVALSDAIACSLAELGLNVSTGPVVDFRVKEHLRQMPEPGTVPLLYPCHFRSGGTSWPMPNSKKPNAMVRNGNTEKWLYPSGYYCVVRRFSAKEEKRRIVASVVDPNGFEAAPVLGFENHLNLFHENKRGLPPQLAHGLAVFLNTTAVDESFRQFNGHTQVNATDLRRMKYPSRAALMLLGEWAMHAGELSPSMIDQQVAHLIHFNGERFLGPYVE